MPKLALRAQTVDIADLPLRQDVLAKIGSMNRLKTFRFEQQPVKTRPKGLKQFRPCPLARVVYFVGMGASRSL